MVDVGHIATVGVSAVRCAAKQRDEQTVVISINNTDNQLDATITVY
jgi:hypothetical protein